MNRPDWERFDALLAFERRTQAQAVSLLRARTEARRLGLDLSSWPGGRASRQELLTLARIARASCFVDNDPAWGRRARVCVLAIRARRLIRRGAPARLAIAAAEALVGPFDGVAERAEGWVGRLVEDAPAGAQRLRLARELAQCHPVAWPSASFRFSEAL